MTKYSYIIVKKTFRQKENNGFDKEDFRGLENEWRGFDRSEKGWRAVIV